MEETQPEEQLAPFDGLFAVVQVLVVEAQVRPHQVGLHPLEQDRRKGSETVRGDVKCFAHEIRGIVLLLGDRAKP